MLNNTLLIKNARSFRSFLLTTCLIVLSTTLHAQYFNTPTYREKSPSVNSYQAPSTNTYNTVPASRYNSGYTRQNGTVVDPYNSTVPDNTNLNNYSTQGNINPYTGQTGTRARDYSSEASNYGQGRTIQTDPRGGQYYINDNGNKVYVPKRSNPY